MRDYSTVAAIGQFLLAQAEPGAAPVPRSPLGNMWFFFAAMIAIMWFFLIRPNQKRERERRDMLAALSKGDKVITTGGICGTIVGLTDKAVVLRVSDDPQVKMEFVRGAVSRVTSQKEEDEK